MKNYFITILTILVFTAQGYGGEPLTLQSPLTIDFNSVLKLVRANLNGWTKISFNGKKTLWTPHTFYTQRVSDPKQWVSQIQQMEFCQPDKIWKDFPVLSVANEDIAGNFEQVALNPKLDLTTQMVYSETVIQGGKARNVSYDYRQNGPLVKISCSAANELGEVQTIQQDFDIRNPKNFQVEQKKNGQTIQI